MSSLRDGQLQRGHHQLTRDEVIASQRGRMLEAMIEAAGELGYANASVNEVIKRAGVSRRTFYEQFDDRQACFIAAYDTVVSVLFDRILPNLETSGTPTEQVESLVATYLDTIASEPTIARVLLVEAYAAGPATMARRAKAQDDMLEFAIELLDISRDESRFASAAFIHALVSMVTTEVALGRAEQVRELAAPATVLLHQTIEQINRGR